MSLRGREDGAADAPAGAATGDGAPSAPGAERGTEDSGWTCVGPATKYAGKRTDVKVRLRRVTVLDIRGAWVCLDTICYHAGGPLTEGTLRRVAGRVCLECPWHRYLVDVETGEGLYLDMNRRFRSKGVRQRVHDVLERDGLLWVKVLEEGEVASDGYARGPRFAGREDDGGVKEFPCGELDW